MLGRSYDREVCSAARALEIAGERWSLLILRNAMFAGMTRFTDFEQGLGIAPNVLATRLEGFVAEGLMETVAAASGHAEYRLTDKGLDFKPVIIALTEWGDRWAAPDGAPIAYRHSGCEGTVGVHLQCGECGTEPSLEEVVARPTPAMALARRRRGLG
ncbi:MAG: helix-turn-helix transcriptional regulator [Gemmatimonadales bacterium]|nr:helix-turn-helix transcriptional regulator [Gemmatimonadales bacterium]